MEQVRGCVYRPALVALVLLHQFARGRRGRHLHALYKRCEAKPQRRRLA